ncbi:hypothetical protein Agub_g11446, partial [Astrephomene gubernaculifera]
ELRRLRDIARVTYQDRDYVGHVDALLPLLQETEQLGDVARRRMLPELEGLQSELTSLQAALAERQLPRDRLMAFLDQLRNRKLMITCCCTTTTTRASKESNTATGTTPDMDEGGRAAAGTAAAAGAAAAVEVVEGGWPNLTPDEAVCWRYPPLEYYWG